MQCSPPRCTLIRTWVHRDGDVRMQVERAPIRLLDALCQRVGTRKAFADAVGMTRRAIQSCIERRRVTHQGLSALVRYLTDTYEAHDG